MYPVTITDKNGNVKQVLNENELSQKHWGHSKICIMCKIFYFPIMKRGKQGIILDHTAMTTYTHEPVNKKPESDTCSPLCSNLKVAQRKAVLAEVKKIVKHICEVCKNDYTPKRKLQKYCTDACRAKIVAIQAAAKTKRLAEGRKERRKLLERTQ